MSKKRMEVIWFKVIYSFKVIIKVKYEVWVHVRFINFFNYDEPKQVEVKIKDKKETKNEKGWKHYPI